MLLNPLIRKLGSQTAVYGLSSIVARFLNYLLVPLHTRIFSPDEYGVVTELFAYAAFLNIIFQYGMETAYFRFASREKDSGKIYSTAISSIFFSTLLLSGLLLLFAQPIANTLRYPDHAEYIRWFALIIGLDALIAIPFARLRLENRPFRFAFFKVLNIGINVLFNVLFLLLIPYILSNQRSGDLHLVIRNWYDPDTGVGYVFLSTLIASGCTLLFLGRYFISVQWKIDVVIWKKMVVYALPLIVVGLAGMVDELFSRVILKYRLPVSNEEAMYQLGIFGANYKLAIIMTLFVQAFRMAAEPFFFTESSKSDARLQYAKAMNYFTISCCFIFLFVMAFIDVFQNIFTGKEFHEGIKVVPILLMANLFLGVYYNLTIWYKLTDKTSVGAGVAIYGAIITFLLNWFLIPVYGYMGSAWATFICYGSMIIISYFLGQKYFQVNYSVVRFFAYLFLSVGLFFILNFIKGNTSVLIYYILVVVALVLFATLAYLFETGKVAVFKPIR